MRIEKLNKEMWYWLFPLALSVVFLVGVGWGYKYYKYDRPVQIQQAERKEAVNHTYERVGNETYSEKLQILTPVTQRHETFAIGSTLDASGTPIQHVSGDRESVSHYFKLSSNKEEILRYVVRLHDDKILFSRWIDTGEVDTWQRFDQAQEKLAKDPTNPQLIQEVTKLKEQHPELTN